MPRNSNITKRIHHTKEDYEQALLLRDQGVRIIEISKKLLINFGTIWTWLNTSSKPRCISDAWKKTSKEKTGNLGKHAKRNKIYLEQLTKLEQAYLLGTYLGDGNSHKGFDLQVKDMDFATYVAELISKVSGTQAKAVPYERKREYGIEKGFRVRLSRYDLKDWLELVLIFSSLIAVFTQMTIVPN
jgi:hypothetical protein